MAQNTPILGKIKSSESAASLDAKYGPYASKAAADAALGENGDDVITAGLTVGVTQSDGSVKEFWYQPDGQGGLQLVEKQVAAQEETDPTVPAWAKASSKPSYTASEVGAIPDGDKGVANGVATLGSDGKVPQSQLPSYVDDVLEYPNQSSFPATGESGKIYVALDTNKTYRWGGSAYIEISQSLALGETSSTAFAGDRGKAIEDKIPSGASSSNKLVTASDLIGKVDKVSGTTPNNFASFDLNGDLQDSGKKATDFAPAYPNTGSSTDDGKILEKDSTVQGGVKWVEKPQNGTDGKDAYHVWLDANGWTGQESTHPVSEYLDYLKAHISQYVNVSYDATAYSDLIPTGGSAPKIGEVVTSNSGAISGKSPGTTTLDKIVLMPNNDSATGTGNPSAMMMFVTNEIDNSPNANTYQFVYAGNLDSADIAFRSGQYVNQVDIVDDVTTGGVNNVLSAEQGCVLDTQLNETSAKITGRSDNFDEGVYLVYDPVLLYGADNNQNISPFIPVTSTDVITVCPGYSAASEHNWMVVIGFDSQKQKITGASWDLRVYLPERTITPTSYTDLAYCRFGFKPNSNAFIKVNGVKVWESKPLIIGIEDYHLNKLGLKKNIYDSNNQYQSWMSGYLWWNSGNPGSSTANSCTGYITIDQYDSIEITTNIAASASDAGVCFYDSERVFISGVKANQGLVKSYEKRILSVPSGAKFVRASFYNDFRQYWELTGIKNPQIDVTPLSKSEKITLEFGNLTSAGEIKPYSSDFFDYARTSLYYKLSSINLPYQYTIYVYGSSYNLIDTISANANVDYELDNNNWHKIVINYEDNSLQKKEIVIELNVLDFSYNIITPKTIKTFQYLVKYKKGRGLYVNGDSIYSEAYNMQDDLISNTLRVYLPSNYTPKGEPVKLIYKAHGTGGYPYIDTTNWGGDDSIDYLADEGFALYDMFAGTSYYDQLLYSKYGVHNRIANYNTPIHLTAQKQAYEWIVKNFNVDPQIYVVGKSHGGLAGIYATNNIVPTRCVALLAPLITQVADKYAPWGLTYPSECYMCLDDMCFIPPTGMTFDDMVTMVTTRASGWKDCLLDNVKQQAGLNPYLNGITNEKQETLLTALMDDTYKAAGGMDNLIRHSYVPVKVWCAPDDDQVLFNNGLNWITSLQNGGSNAQFREFPSGAGGHSFESFTNEASIKDSVVTSLGIPYTAPRAYIEVVNFLNQF